MFAVAALAAITLVATGCGSDGSTEAAQTGSESAGPTLDASIFDGQAQTIGGDTVDLAGFANKDLVVWFWAPW